MQGEGVLLGMPSVFVRTSGCNLRCKWCDTPYTSWKPEGDLLDPNEVVTRATAFGASHVVLTGGEPMLSPSIVELSECLNRKGLHITIETAGTIYAPVQCDLMSISPKLSNSTPFGTIQEAQHEKTRYKPDILAQLMLEYSHQLKFVVSDPADLAEVLALQRELKVPSGSIILMPEGTNSQVIRERGVWLAEICKEYHFRLSPRLHVDLWGSRRGV